MSNMLYSLSIMFKTKLPFIITFNKIDLQAFEYAIKWLTNF